jgi:hypothetical protein
VSSKSGGVEGKAAREGKGGKQEDGKMGECRSPFRRRIPFGVERS